MKKQKIFALGLAAALTLSMSTSVFAASNEVTGTTTQTKLDVANSSDTIEIGSLLHLPTIDVKINAPGKVVVNPYKMQYKIDDSITKTDSLISTVSGIENHSTINVKVTGSPVAVPESGAQIDFLDAATPPDTFTKATAFMQLKMAAVTASRILQT